MKCGCCGFFRSDLIIFLSRIFSWLNFPFFRNIFVALPGNRLFDSPGGRYSSILHHCETGFNWLPSNDSPCYFDPGNLASFCCGRMGR